MEAIVSFVKANSPVRALEYMNDSKLKPNLFFIDKKMPNDNDGAELVVKLLAEHKVSIENIIFQTGGGNSRQDLKFVLYKPFDMPRLKTELKRLFDKEANMFTLLEMLLIGAIAHREISTENIKREFVIYVVNSH